MDVWNEWLDENKEMARYKEIMLHNKRAKKEIRIVYTYTASIN